jgi:hypothetical protein
MIKEIEIEGHGRFKVKKDLTHRPKIELKIDTEEKRFKRVQFDQRLDYHEGVNYFGYDMESNDIQIKIIKK